MKNYDWHQERKKYQASSSGASPQPRQSPVPVPSEKKANPRLWLWSGIILVLLLICAGWFFLRQNDSSVQLARAAEKYRTAVGLVSLRIEMKNGKQVEIPIGTAWRFAENRFATNAHVVFGLRSTLNKAVQVLLDAVLLQQAKLLNCPNVDTLLKKLGPDAGKVVEEYWSQVLSSISSVKADIIINGTQKNMFSISHVQIHKAYNHDPSKFSSDVAVLTTLEKGDVCFPLADRKVLAGLSSGGPVAFLGFPMENLQGENLNISNPIASMQSGIIVAVSGFSLKDAGAAANFLLRHNLPSTGGASGSPMFNRKGEVVGLICAINTVGQVVEGVDNKFEVERAPSGAMINFAVRSDLLSGVDRPIALNDFLK